MDNASMFMMIDVISLGCGAYCVYTWLRLLREKKLFKNGLLIPKDLSPEDCLDEEGYIAYISPRLAVLAVVTLLYGIVQMLNNTVLETPFLTFGQSMITLGVVMAVLIWYAVANSKANREYFGM